MSYCIRPFCITQDRARLISGYLCETKGLCVVHILSEDGRTCAKRRVACMALICKHLLTMPGLLGERHGGFVLPVGQAEARVVELAWNCDSSVLAVWLEDQTQSASAVAGSRLQLWTSSNYHSYLKLELTLGLRGSFVVEEGGRARRLLLERFPVEDRLLLDLALLAARFLLLLLLQAETDWVGRGGG